MVASILRSFAANALWSKNQVPQGDLAIDWTHNLTNGLIGAWVPGAMGGVEITGFGPTLITQIGNVAGTPFIDITPDGPGLRSSGHFGDGYGATTPPNYRSILGSGLSMFWRGLVLGGGNNYTPVLMISWDNSSGGPAPVMSIGDRAGNSFYLTWNDGTTAQLLFGENYPAFPFFRSWAATFQTGAQAIYVNGIQTGTSALASVPTIGATSETSIQRYTSGNLAGTNTACNCAYIWNRVLSAAEMLQLHLDPYGFLVPADEQDMQQMPPPPLPFILMPQIVT